MASLRRVTFQQNSARRRGRISTASTTASLGQATIEPASSRGRGRSSTASNTASLDQGSIEQASSRGGGRIVDSIPAREVPESHAVAQYHAYQCYTYGLWCSDIVLLAREQE